jgi:hypothetical protein
MVYTRTLGVPCFENVENGLKFLFRVLANVRVLFWRMFGYYYTLDKRVQAYVFGYCLLAQRLVNECSWRSPWHMFAL